MTEILQQAIQRVQENIEELQTTISWAKKALPANLPNVVCMNIYDSYIAVEIPPTPKAIRELRKALAANFKFYHSFFGNSGSRFIKYKHKDYSERDLTVLMDVDLATDNCRIEQVGIKEIPVYQIICQ